MTRGSTGKRQRGAAWWLLLMALALASAHLLLAGSHPGRDDLAVRMARAKEALIARAVNDANRPGSLPCPDRLTDSAGMNNVPGDGRADLFTLTRCPTYIGWLPWATLELPETTDASGNRLWYVLAPGLRDDDSAQPINSDSATGLQLDDDTGVAALLIAGGPPLTGQRRPSVLPGDHLDAANGDGDDHRYVSRANGQPFNDRVLAITGRELMAAVGKRVAAEVSACLAAHAASPANRAHRYPWPAPPGGPPGRGLKGSLFGRLPATEPGNGLQAALGDTRTTLSELGQRIAAGDMTSDLLDLLRELDAGLVHARNLADALAASASRIRQAALAVGNSLAQLDATLVAATGNDRISVTEGRTIRSRSAASDDTLAALAEALADTGFDPHPWHSRRLAGELAGDPMPAQREAAIDAARTLLSASRSERADIVASLAAATQAAELAQAAALAAAAAPGSPELGEAAKSAAGALGNALRQLAETVDAGRCRLGAGEIGELADLLAGTGGGELIAVPADRHQLVGQRVTAVACRIPSVAAARNEALAALQIGNGASIEGAIEALRRLAAAMATHEAIEGNLTRSSLRAASERYTLASGSFAEIDTRTPRPVQRDIVPYAESVRAAAVDLAFWAKIIAEQGESIVPAARSQSTDGQPDDSAYRAAEDALSALNDRNGSRSLLESYLKAPGNARLSAASEARTATLAALDTVLQRLGGLEALSTAGPAAAAPMVWGAARCDFLRPGVRSWWSENAWHDTVFYQIGQPLSAGEARLAVNGQRRYRLVAVAAGRALPGQARGPSSGIAAYLEGGNAAPSRDGSATSPATDWYLMPPSGNFNDRLAYRP